MKICLVLLLAFFGNGSIFGIAYSPLQDKTNLNGTFTRENLKKAVQYCETLGVRMTSSQEENYRLLEQMDDTVQIFGDLKTFPNSNKKYYIHSSSRTNWFQALHFCMVRNMHLVSIMSKEENDRIVKLITDAHLANERFWTAGTNFGNNGNFYWIGSGRPMTYANWQPDDSNYLSVNDDCVELTNYHGTIKWNDAPWFYQKYFICES